MKSIIITTACAILLLVMMACKDKNSNIQNIPISTVEDEIRYYAFKLKAYRDQHRHSKERKLINNRWQDIDLNVAIKLSPGSNNSNIRRNNPYIAVRNMDDPTECYQVESRYDRDADPPIYEKGRAKSNYRTRLNFQAFDSSGREGEGRFFKFIWLWGAKFTDYGIMQRFQINQIRIDKYSLFFLQEKPIKISPQEIKQKFFNSKADKICQQTIAQKNINKPPLQKIYYHTLMLKKFKGAGKSRKELNQDMKIAIRIDFSVTKGGSQYVNVIVKNIDKTSSCFAFSRYAKTIDWMVYKGKQYTKHIEIAKKFGDSDRYYMITWVLDDKKKARLAYFYLDEQTGGPYYEYIHTDNSLTTPAMTSDAIAEKYFSAPNPATGCTTPNPKQR